MLRIWIKFYQWGIYGEKIKQSTNCLRAKSGESQEIREPFQLPLKKKSGWWLCNVHHIDLYPVNRQNSHQAIDEKTSYQKIWAEFKSC